MVFQRPALYPHLSVRANLGFGLALRRTWFRLTPDERGRVDPRKLRSIARLGGDYYTRTSDLFEMKDVTGKWIYRSPDMEAYQIDTPDVPLNEFRIESTRMNGIPLRVLTSRIQIGSREYEVATAVSLSNYENAVKRFAQYREITDGQVTEEGLNDYLVLLSVYQTCKYKGVGFLKFLLSQETDIDVFREKGAKKRPVSAVEIHAEGRPSLLPNRKRLDARSAAAAGGTPEPSAETPCEQGDTSPGRDGT